MKKANKKPYSTDITRRMLQLMEEVLHERLAKNKGEFAKSIGEYPQNLSMWEKDQRAPTLEQVAVACATYQYNPAWIILGVGSKKMRETEQKSIDHRVSTLEIELAQIKRFVSNGRLKTRKKIR